MYSSSFIMWIWEWCLMEVHDLCLPIKITIKKIRDIIGKFIGEYVALLQNNIQFLEDVHEDLS